MKMEITSNGRQMVPRVFCPACGKTGHKHIRKTGIYEKGGNVDYYRCLRCVMSNTRKPFTFAVEVVTPQPPFVRRVDADKAKEQDSRRN